MLQRLTIPGIDLPRLYIAENKKDVDIAMSNGVPYIKWNYGHLELVKRLLRPILEKKFPDILWYKVLGKKKKIESRVCIPKIDKDSKFVKYDLENPVTDKELKILDFYPGIYGDSSGVDDFAPMPSGYGAVGAPTHKGSMHTISISDYCGDLSACVNIETLQSLKLLPSFIGNIVDCIKKNNQSVLWTEGYNKKLRQAVGNFNRGRECRNLIILDVSVSIPRGISATMINLIDTLRYQTSADLLITGGDTGFYKHGEILPSPDEIYAMYGGCNETTRFLRCMKDNVIGREWGHVIAFGDDNEPNLSESNFSWSGTKVHEAHHYHTCIKRSVGYANWMYMLANKPDHSEYNTSWCNVICK